MHNRISHGFSPRITDEVTGLCSDREADGEYTRVAAWQELLTRTALPER